MISLSLMVPVYDRLIAVHASFAAELVLAVRCALEFFRISKYSQHSNMYV